ncbi:MAG TPA: DUF3500 domain-containing protein, partial [Prolixibacteraceae bacterium]|nr:DUF3500 domain-containing protein [Prolixibacteraceae bacterium]
DSKYVWHYLPAVSFPRTGISLAELDKNQKDLLFNLLKSSLSETGYAKSKQIISLEEVLAEMSGNTDYRNPEKYYTAFYGNPAKDSLWSWAFQGHHLSLNFTILNGKTSIAPRFFGANPAIIKQGKRKGERTLAAEDDMGLELINSMNAQQKEKTIINDRAFYDIITTNSDKVEPLEPAGIKMKDLNPQQKITLLKLIETYLEAMPDELAVKRMQNLKKEETSEIMFAWAGATELGKGHYYRVQGKSFLIEFDNTQNHANHIHSVWRDFDGDFGKNLIREHYKSSEHHH